MSDTLIQPPVAPEEIPEQRVRDDRQERVISGLEAALAEDAIKAEERNTQIPEATMPTVPKANELDLRTQQEEAARAQVIAQAPEAPVAPVAPAPAPEAAPVVPQQAEAAPAPAKKWWQKLLGGGEK